MEVRTKKSQQLTWWLSPAKKSDTGFPYEEGKHLPASIEEDVGSYQLCPVYSPREMRRIKRLSIAKNATENPRYRNSKRKQNHKKKNQKVQRRVDE